MHKFAHLKEKYQNQGYLVLENFFSPQEAQVLKQRSKDLVKMEDCSALKSIFSTQEVDPQRDKYFLTSGDQIRFFFEKEAFDSTGMLIKPPELAFNKIGHALHELDPVFKKFSHHPDLKELMLSLGMISPLLMQSMYIFKGPEFGGEVLPHQDKSYLYTTPHNPAGLWFALDDATTENGCLWVLPQGHHRPLKSRYFRQGLSTHTEIYDSSPWPLEEFIPLEVKTGTLIVFDGLLPHMSYANTSPFPRNAYTLHVIEENDEYADNNWLQETVNKTFVAL